MEKLETIIFEGEKIKISDDGQNLTINEGILRGEEYIIETYPVTGDEDYDPYSRLYTLLHNGRIVELETGDLLEADPISFPKQMLKYRALIKKRIDDIAQEIINQAKQRDVLGAFHAWDYFGYYSAVVDGKPVNLNEKDLEKLGFSMTGIPTEEDEILEDKYQLVEF